MFKVTEGQAQGHRSVYLCLCCCVAAIRVYRVVGDVGMVMALQTVRVSHHTRCHLLTAYSSLLPVASFKFIWRGAKFCLEAN